jgi:hypothetical protein
MAINRSRPSTAASLSKDERLMDFDERELSMAAAFLA